MIGGRDNVIRWIGTRIGWRNVRVGHIRIWIRITWWYQDRTSGLMCWHVIGW